MENIKYLTTNPGFLLKRLIEQYRKQDKLIIAYDFDDTVKPYWGEGCSDVQSILRRLRDNINAYFIVYTTNENHDEIRKYLDKYDIPYDAINEEAPFSPFKGGKIFYNVFLDDKAGLGEVVRTLDQFLYYVLNDDELSKKKVKDEEFPEECKGCIFLHKNPNEDSKYKYICCNPYECLEGVQEVGVGLD